MDGSRQLIRIFVASPSDVQEERDRLHDDVVAELNQHRGVADHYGCTLQVLDWREAVPGMGRAEGVILDQLDVKSWDIFVGFFWMRFGSPSGGCDPETGRFYDSGTEEEFWLAYRANRDLGRPHILFYRCEREYPPEQLRDEKSIEQLGKVNAFFEEFAHEGEHPGLFQPYKTPDDFARRLRTDLSKVLGDIADDFHPDSHADSGDDSENRESTRIPDELIPTSIGWKECDSVAVQRFFSYYAEEVDVTDDSQVFEKLEGLRLICQMDNDWVLTKVGALLFGPEERIGAYWYTDTQLSDRRRGLIKPYHGLPAMQILFELIDELRPLWEEEWESASVRDSKGRRSRVAPYPETAIVEALVNFIIHRDYEANDQAWISLYEDRIELTNPGSSRYDEEELLAGQELRPKYTAPQI